MPSRGLRSKGFCSENHPIEPPRDVFTYTSFLPRCISILTSPIDVDKSYIPFTDGPNMERVPFSFGPRIENAKLVLREDGSFVAVGLPRVAFDGASGTGDVAGQGKWEIDKGTQDWWSVRLEWPIRSDTHVVHYEPLYVRHQSPEHLLHKDIDLDMGHAIVFYREVKGRQKGDVRKTGDRAADR